MAQALSRYPARAGVLVAPVFGGLATVGNALRRNPAGTLPVFFGGQLRLRAVSSSAASWGRRPAKEYARPGHRRDGAAGALAAAGAPARTEAPVGDPPVLVIGSPDDRVVPRRSLERVARRYGGAPLLFPGMGHDLMLDARWQEPIDAILDWLEKSN